MGKYGRHFLFFPLFSSFFLLFPFSSIAKLWLIKIMFKTILMFTQNNWEKTSDFRWRPRNFRSPTNLYVFSIDAFTNQGQLFNIFIYPSKLLGAAMFIILSCQTNNIEDKYLSSKTSKYINVILSKPRKSIILDKCFVCPFLLGKSLFWSSHYQYQGKTKYQTKINFSPLFLGENR